MEPFNFEFKHSMRMWSKKEMTGNYRVQLNVAGYEFYGQAEVLVLLYYIGLLTTPTCFYFF